MVIAEHPNAHRMRQATEGFTAGDLERVLAVFPEDVVWYSPGKGRLAGTYRGRADLERVFRTMYERSGGAIRAEAEDVLASDDHVVVFLRITAQREDARLDVQVAHFAT